MIAADRIRERALSLELGFIRLTSFLEKIPFLASLHRKVTADVEILGPETGAAMRLRVRFRSPYLNLPLEVEETQVGYLDEDRRFRPAAFRFFDWHTWAHIDGDLEWSGERRINGTGQGVGVITGFTYRITDIPVSVEVFGLRIAEGVEGTARVVQGGQISRMKFEPFYWMLEPKDAGYNLVAIHDHDLMVLIVSLSIIGIGKDPAAGKAIDDLENWVRFKLGSGNPGKIMLGFLGYVRDWGPLRMPPLFHGLKTVLQRLGVREQERILYDFYADNWGLRDNWHGRLLAVKMLEALATQKARLALNSIYGYVKYRDVQPEELQLIEAARHRSGDETRGGIRDD